MAPKRPAPPPPVDSSEETASGSGSDESEEIAYSPAPSAAPKNTAPPPQKVQQPEEDDDEEDDDEDDDDEEEEEEEEEEGKVNQATPPSTTKNPPPPNRDDSDSESEEGDEEETDDEAPESNPAPKQEAEGKGGKPLASSEDKKPAGRFIRVWSKDDDMRILEALAAHRREHGTLPQPDELEAALAGSLDHSDYGRKELLGKLRTMKAAYTRQFNKGEQPSKDIDRRIYNLSKEVWGRGDMPENGTAPRDFGEMCELYPYFAEEIKGIEKTHLGLFKREFGMISDAKASALDAKIKKQRLMESKVELHRYENFKEVIKTLMDLVE